MSPAAPGDDPGVGAQRLWTGEFVLAVVVNALTVVVFYLLMTTMALYAARQFAASDAVAGLASSMFIVGAVGARLFAAPLMTLLGSRRALVWALAVYILMALAYFVALDLALLLAVRFVHGIAHGIASTAAAALAQSIIPPRRRGEGTGYFTLGVPFAAAVGPLAALALIDRWGYEALFVGNFVVSALGFGAALLLPVRPWSSGTGRTRRPGQRLRLPSWRSMVDRNSVPLATVMLFIGVANASVLTFAHPFTESTGLSGAAGLFFAINAVGVLLSRLFAGRVQDRWGDNWVVYPGVVIYGVGLATLASARSVPLLVVAGVLVGLGFGILMPAIQAAAVRVTHPQNIGLAVATFYLMVDIGTGFGPVVLGVIVGAWDYRVMYLVAGALALAAGGHYALVHGRRARTDG